MSLPALDNLVRIGQLKTEPRNSAELARMLARARRSLTDAAVTGISASTRFICAYSAGHAAALAALRWHGYRSENRFTVFQCLVIRSGGPMRAGVYWMPLTAGVIWLNMRVFWRWRNPPSLSCLRWWMN